MNVYSLQGTVIYRHNQKPTGTFSLKGIAICLLLLAGLLAGTTAAAQQVTLNEKNAPLKKIFQLIKKQTGSIFFYEKDALDKSTPVTIQVKNANIREVLDICLANQQLTYFISGNNIGIKKKPLRTENAGPGQTQVTQAVAAILITGQVTDTLGRPKEGVTVINSPRGGGKTFTVTNADGNFEIFGQKGDRLTFTALGHKNADVKYNGEISIHITLRIAPIEMNAVVIDDANLSKRRIPFTDTINMTHRTHLNLGQLLQGSIPGLTLQNSSQSEQTLESIDFDGAIMAGGRVPTIEALRAYYQQWQSVWAERGFPTFDSWINQFKGQQFKFNYRTTVNSNGLIPQLRGVSGFNGNTSGMLVIIDGFPQDGFPATYPMANIESVKVIKDPEELGKWGPKAAGGIIMITSKRSSVGKLQVSYASNFYFSPAPRLNRSQMRLATSADLIDYLKAAADSGFLKLGSKDYPFTAFTLSPAQRIIQHYQQESISRSEYDRRMDSLARLNNESQLRLLQQNAFDQNQTLTLSGGVGPWRFRAAGGYNTSRTSNIGDRGQLLTFNMNNDFSLFHHKLRAQLYINSTHNTGRSTTFTDVNELRPYQLLVDPVTGRYAYDNTDFDPEANAVIQQYGYYNQGVNRLEDARLNSIVRKNLQLQSRLNIDWDLLPSLKWSTSFQYDRTNIRTEDFMDAASSGARQLVNQYGSPVFDNNNVVTGIDFYVPKGGIMKKSRSEVTGWNVRSALQFSKNFGRHEIAATLGGGGFANDAYFPSIYKMYGYNRQTGQGQPIRLPSPDPAAGIPSLYNLPERYFSETAGQLVYPGTLLAPDAGDTTLSRGLNWNAGFSYAYDSTYLLNGRLNNTLSPNYGHRIPYTRLLSYAADAGWRLSRMAFFNTPAWLSNITLSAGVEGMSIPSLPIQINASRSLQNNWNNYGIWVTGFSPPQQSGQQSYNVYEKLTVGVNRDRLVFDVAYNTLSTGGISDDGTQATGRQTKNYVSASGRLKLRDGLLHLYAGYNYSLDGQPQTNIRVLYDIARETYFNAPVISKLSADFTLQHISSFQGMELMTGTNTPLSGGGFSMAINNQFGLLPPRIRNLEAHTTLGLNNDRYLLDLRFYQKNTAGLNNNIPVPTDPATGLTSKLSYSEIVTKGVETYLRIAVVQRSSFKYAITLNGAYNRNIALKVPPVNFSATPTYLNAYRNGYGIENIWSYRWAGLDANGAPGIYDAKGQRTATPDTATLINALVYSGVIRPPFTGGLIQEWDYKGFFARVTLLLNFGHVMREYIPSSSREEEKSVLIRDRWRKPGDEAFTQIPAMSGNAGSGSIRRLITQYSSNSVMPADNIRLQEVQIGWQGKPGKILRSYLFKDLTISLQAMNLALWTRNKLHVDPETVANTGQISLPMPKQYSLAVNMRF